MQTPISILLVIMIYPYVFYPAFLYVISEIKQKYQRVATNEQPLVSVIVPVYNGESLISSKI